MLNTDGSLLEWHSTLPTLKVVELQYWGLRVELDNRYPFIEK